MVVRAFSSYQLFPLPLAHKKQMPECFCTTKVYADMFG